MDTSTYDQVALEKESLGEGASWLKESITVQIVFYKSKPISVELPNFVELQVASTEPGIRGDTAQGAVKPATLESGATVNVPLFLNEGDVIRIDTRTGAYVERVTK